MGLAADAVSHWFRQPASVVVFALLRPSPVVCRTLRISCEAVPPSVLPAGAQGGTLSCRSGAALSFVSCIRLFGGAALLLAQTRPWNSALDYRQLVSLP
jgi:hypothetical protein